jgi:hypothetical protein
MRGSSEASLKDADEDQLLEFASGLAGSRKAALLGLVKRIDDRVERVGSRDA